MFSSEPAVVLGLDDVRAALAPGRPRVLVSAEGAGIWAGCLWWRALIDLAERAFPGLVEADVLDCAGLPLDHPRPHLPRRPGRPRRRRHPRRRGARSQAGAVRKNLLFVNKKKQKNFVRLAVLLLPQHGIATTPPLPHSGGGLGWGSLHEDRLCHPDPINKPIQGALAGLMSGWWGLVLSLLMRRRITA
eukprot:gene55430-75957_t